MNAFGDRNGFQFQHGAIKSTITLLPTKTFLNFNSNMVRLKVQQTHRCSKFRRHFNSNMVRLKERRK